MKQKIIFELKTFVINVFLCDIYNYAFSACKVWILTEAEIKMHPDLHGKVLCLRKVLPWKNSKIKTLKFVALEQQSSCRFIEPSHTEFGIYLRFQ